MLLTRLFKHVMSENIELSCMIMSCILLPLNKSERLERIMAREEDAPPLPLHQPSVNHSHLNDDDNDGNDKGTSHASTPSPTHITLSLSPITPLDHILDTPSSPSPQPPPQPPLIGHPIYFNTFDYHGVTGTSVLEVFVAHYEAFLGTSTACDDLYPTSLFVMKVSESINAHMLLKEVNHTFLALIPKVTTPLKVNDYRPISCYNVLYKCISKILTNRIIKGIKEVVSGLVPSIPKSMVFFCNVVNHVKLSILNVMPFSEGVLPVNYLGVPLISSRLLNKDCKVLVEKTRNRIRDWKNKSLSFAGRLQLCNYVISSMQVYWASVLAIPFGIIDDIQQLIHGFLWCNGEYKKRKAKVSWEDICLPKREGGLGIQCLKVGNGLRTSLWYDTWCDQSSLANFLTPRDITRNGFHLRLILVPVLNDTEDYIRWPNGNGNVTSFSVKCAWEALRPQGVEVPCFSSKVWSLLHHLAEMERVAPVLEDIIA
ncbi:hypothetical protein Tco_0601277 [Tanacetum coccineum]